MPPKNSIYNESPNKDSAIAHFINFKHTSVFVCDLIKLLERAIFE